MEENIILIGPKAVGKSTIASKLQETLEKKGMGKYTILKLDLFFKYCQDSLNKCLFFTERERKAILNNEISQINQSSKNYEFLKQLLIEDFEKSEDEKFELNELFNFKDFIDIIENYQEVSNVQAMTHMFCNDTFMIFDQTIYLKILERCLKKYKKPLIIDAGANIGPVYNMDNQDLTYIQYKFPDIDIKTYQRKIMEEIPFKVFIEPCDGYENLKCPDIRDAANRMYLKHSDSYRRFANISTKPRKLYTMDFASFDRDNPVDRIEKSLFIDEEEILRVANDISKQIENLKTFE